MTFSYRLGGRVGEWFAEPGPEGDVAISTRVRLARNIDGFPFSARLTAKEAKQLSGILQENVLLASRPKRLRYIPLEHLDYIQRQLLLERHLISPEHTRGSLAHGVAVGAREIVSVMVNEEDHLRIQVLRSGLRPLESFESARQLDRKIAQRVPYVRSPKFGFLTSCPSNAGTGLRVSVMLHLPALCMSEQIEKIGKRYGRQGVEIRGLYGEGSHALGDLFQFSNRITLGVPEKEIIADVEDRVSEVIGLERQTREQWMKKQGDELGAQIRQAIENGSAATAISSQDTMSTLSLLRLGIHLGIFRRPSIGRLNELFLWIQPGHLQHLSGKRLNPRERDRMRAQLLRRWCAKHLPFAG